MKLYHPTKYTVLAKSICPAMEITRSSRSGWEPKTTFLHRERVEIGNWILNWILGGNGEYNFWKYAGTPGTGRYPTSVPVGLCFVSHYDESLNLAVRRVKWIESICSQTDCSPKCTPKRFHSSIKFSFPTKISNFSKVGNSFQTDHQALNKKMKSCCHL